MKREPLYKRYENKQACGVCYMGQYGGLELLDIDACEGEYGVAVACFNWGTGRQKIRRYKIQIRKEKIKCLNVIAVVKFLMNLDAKL